MTIPINKKDQAIYHTILADMHRLRAILLSLQTLDDPATRQALQEHFSREQSVVLGRLTEWRQRRAEIYSDASTDFAQQVRNESS